ncbi:hypothetical protein OESDEN_09623, partial [Oesophagostomum dentatum]
MISPIDIAAPDGCQRRAQSMWSPHRAHPNTRDDENAPNKLQVIDVKANTSSTDPNIISTWSQTASLCKGDSGGPLFQSNTGRIYTIIGIASTATRCDMFFI